MLFEFLRSLKEKFFKSFSRYGMVNWFLLFGAVTSILVPKELPMYLGVGLMLLLLDYLETLPNKFFSSEIVGKTIFLCLLSILCFEGVYFYL